jgi:hypothetical protein
MDEQHIDNLCNKIDNVILSSRNDKTKNTFKAIFKLCESNVSAIDKINRINNYLKEYTTNTDIFIKQFICEFNKIKEHYLKCIGEEKENKKQSIPVKKEHIVNPEKINEQYIDEFIANGGSPINFLKFNLSKNISSYLLINYGYRLSPVIFNIIDYEMCVKAFIGGYQHVNLPLTEDLCFNFVKNSKCKMYDIIQWVKFDTSVRHSPYIIVNAFNSKVSPLIIEEIIVNSNEWKIIDPKNQRLLLICYIKKNNTLNLSIFKRIIPENIIPFFEIIAFIN